MFGYECGFFRGYAGVARFWITGVAAFFGVVFILNSGYEKEINIPMFGAEDMSPDHPHWKDFQDFLKEREENV